MKKNRVNEILMAQSKRRSIIIAYTCAIVLVAVLAVGFMISFIQKNKAYEVNYKENSKIDYEVYLKENDFFDSDYLGKDNQYIASLIEYINARFNYELEMDEDDLNYDYNYRIEANVNVEELSTNKSLYNKSRVLVDEQTFNSNKSSTIRIDEQVYIDYNYYNNLINKFVKVYELDNVESTLTINMYVNILGSCEKFGEDSKNEAVVSMSIPLTTKTVGIDIDTRLINNADNVIICEKDDQTKYAILFFDIILIVILLMLIVKLWNYVVTTRTAEGIYDNELKKILNNYSSYIQKINNDFDLNGYQVLKVDTFNDMLEIRDTIQQPILMVENKEKTGTYFIIPSNTRILYFYGLKVSEIKKQLEEDKKED